MARLIYSKSRLGLRRPRVLELLRLAEKVGMRLWVGRGEVVVGREIPADLVGVKIMGCRVPVPVMGSVGEGVGWEYLGVVGMKGAGGGEGE